MHPLLTVVRGVCFYSYSYNNNNQIKAASPCSSPLSSFFWLKWLHFKFKVQRLLGNSHFQSKVPSWHVKCFFSLYWLYYPANTWGVSGGGRLSLSMLLASMAETVQVSGYFSRMSFTSRWTLSVQESRSAWRLWAASITFSCRLLMVDSCSRLWLSWARTGLVAATPAPGPVWGHSPSALLHLGEAWPDM